MFDHFTLLVRVGEDVIIIPLSWREGGTGGGGSVSLLMWPRPHHFNLIGAISVSKKSFPEFLVYISLGLKFQALYLMCLLIKASVLTTKCMHQNAGDR